MWVWAIRRTKPPDSNSSQNYGFRNRMAWKERAPNTTFDSSRDPDRPAFRQVSHRVTKITPKRGASTPGSEHFRPTPVLVPVLVFGAAHQRRDLLKLCGTVAHIGIGTVFRIFECAVQMTHRTAQPKDNRRLTFVR